MNYRLVVFITYSPDPKDHYIICDTVSKYRDTLESFIIRNGSIWFNNRDNVYIDYRFKVRLINGKGDILFFFNPYDPEKKYFYFEGEI